MKNTIKRIGGFCLILTAVFFAACSDGEMQPTTEQEFNIAPASPMIKSFEADPKEVKAGGTTNISWEVIGADSVEITAISTGAPLAFHVQTSELKGAAPAVNLTDTTDFILTATKKIVPPEEKEGDKKKTSDIGAGDAKPGDKKPAAGVSSISQTLTVKVIPASEFKVTASADNTKLNSGEMTILRWEATPSDVKVEISAAGDSSTGTMYSGDDCTEKDPAKLLENGTPTTNEDGIKASGCSVIDPAETTRYTVSATNADGETKTAEVTVEVVTPEIKASVMVNGKISDVLTGSADLVTVSWTVEPAGAVVTVTSDPPAKCTPDLPAGKVVKYTSSQCRLSALPTTFAIKVGGKDMGQATVLQGEVSADIYISSSAHWAFAGEEAEISIFAKDGSQQNIREVVVTDEGGAHVLTGKAVFSSIKVKVPKEGVSVSMTDTAGKTRDYGVVLGALPMSIETADGAVAVTNTSIDSKDPSKRYTGVMMPGFNKGIVRIYISAPSGRAMRDIEFGEALKAADGIGPLWNNDVLDKAIGTYPVNVVTANPADSKQIYVGTTGGFMVSDVEFAGNSKSTPPQISFFKPSRRISTTLDSYDGQHPTCRGETQKGTKPIHENQIVSLNQVCDIAVGKTSRTIIATDNGVFGISDINVFRADESAKKPANERKVLVTGADSPLYGHVVDDLACADDECKTVFAASDLGVFRSDDGGVKWTKYGDLPARPFALAVAHQNHVIAGTSDGVFESFESSDVVFESSGGGWKSLGLAGSKVLAVAISESSNGGGCLPMPGFLTIVAATSSGVKVSRDGGMNWSAITAGGKEAVTSIALYSASDGVANQVSFAMGVGNKIISGETKIGLKGFTASCEPRTPPPLPEPPEPPIVPIPAAGVASK